MPQVPLPRVPDSTQSTPRVTGPQGVVPVQDVAGQQIQQGAAALSNLGAHTTEIAAQMNEDHALATTASALNQFDDTANGIFSGYTSKVGRDAVDFDGQRVESGVASGKVAEQIEAEMRSTEEGLSSDLAKSLFRERAERRMVSIRARLLAHEAEQTKVYGHGENVATAGRFSNNYISDGDPVDFANAMTSAREISDDAGHGPEARKTFLLAAGTNMHAGRIAQLLGPNEDAKGADKYLRGLDKDEIDVAVRQRMRTKIDGVLKGEVARKLGIDLVKHRGHRSHKDMVRATAAALPQARQDQIAKIALTQIGIDLGMSKEDMAVPGAWQALLSNPEAMSRLDEKLLTLEHEIMMSRYAGAPHPTDPTSGIHRRSRDTLLEMYEAKEINSEQLLQAQGTVDSQIRGEVLLRNSEAAEILQEWEKILQRSRDTGGPNSIDTLRIDNPDLYQRTVDLGLLSHARALTTSVFQRVTDPDLYDKLTEAHKDGTLANISFQELYATYYPHFNKVAWNAAQTMWSSHHEAAAEGKIKNDPVVRYDVAIRRWLGANDLISDADSKGVPLPTKDEQQDHLNRMDALSEAIRSGAKPKGASSGPEWTNDDILKWLAARELDMVWIENPDRWATSPWFATSALAAPAFLAEWLLRDEKREVQRHTLTEGQPHTIKIGGRHIHMAGRKVLGAKGDPIPVRASEYIRDRWRIDEMKKRLSPTRAAALEQAMVPLAGTLRSPRDLKTQETIERIFAENGLGDAWPTPALQLTYWDRIRY